MRLSDNYDQDAEYDEEGNEVLDEDSAEFLRLYDKFFWNFDGYGFSDI